MRHVIQHARYSGMRESFRLILVGDCHLGNKHCDEKTLKMLAQRIATEERTYWIGLGDYCEWINMRDPRFNPEELPVWLFGAAVDPTTLTLTVKPGLGTATVYTYALGQITKDSTGNYHMDYTVPTGTGGMVYYKWVAAGAAIGAEPGSFAVRSDETA